MNSITQVAPGLTGVLTSVKAVFDLSEIAPAKTVGDWPINEERAPNDIGCGKITPGAGIIAIHGVIPHYHIVIWSHGIDGAFIRKVRGQLGPIWVILTFDIFVYMA